VTDAPGLIVLRETDEPAETVTSMLEQCPIGVTIVGSDLAILYGNAHFAEMAGLDPARRGWPPLDRLLAHPDERHMVRDALAGRQGLARRELSLTAEDGRSVWVLMSAEAIRFAGLPAMLVWLDDITKRRMATDALRASEERLDLAVTGTRSAIWEIDFGAGTSWWSKEFYRMLGYLDDQVPMADEDIWERHIHPEDAARVTRTIRQYLHGEWQPHEAGGEAPVYEATYRLCRLDGSIIWVVAKGRRSANQHGRPRRFNGIMLDVTAQKRAEQALRQAQQDLIQAEKMASLGSLVAGVAHEINTPLGNTLTASSHLYDKVLELSVMLDENRLRRSDLLAFVSLLTETTRLMVTNCERAAELVQSFKQVAVDQTSGERRRFDLKRYIDEVLLSLRPRLRKTGHRIMVDCPDHLEIDGYPGALSQLLTNFLLNSLMHAYAPGEAGEITIRVRLIEDGQIELIYADDGRGIPAELLGRIYDPFFTTRRGSGGSGLGLHIVYNLVTGTLRGQITVASEPDRGTCFIVRFPLRTPTDASKADNTDE
jgi:PAS domain S-box-containing protein